MAPLPVAPLAGTAITAGLSNLPHLVAMVRALSMDSSDYVRGFFVQKTLRPLLESMITRISAHDGIMTRFHLLLKENKASDLMSAAGMGLSLVVLALLLTLVLLATREMKRRNRDHSQALSMLARRNDLISELDQFPQLIR